MPPITPSKSKLTLDFDLETLAAGFADPNWVPQKITAAAWSWVGDDRVYGLVTGKDSFFSRKVRLARLLPLVHAIELADVVTGHNIIRFDLPVLNAELMRCGHGSLGEVMAQDTIRLPKSKGLKKGQDDLSLMLGTLGKKMKLNWEEWDRAYEEEDWDGVLERCKTDVLQHKELRQKMQERGILSKPRPWRP